MKFNSSLQLKIAITLQKIGTEKCMEKAKQLEGMSVPIRILHLRNLTLNASNITAIADCLQEENKLQSISFSYNPLGDLGTTALVKKLPESITDIGLVNCGITDSGGVELLNWMKKSPQLQMVCIEQNNFSVELRGEFNRFSRNNSRILFMF